MDVLMCGEMEFNFLESKDVKFGDWHRVVHMKGFGNAVDFDNEVVQQAVHDIMKQVIQIGPSHIIFDGDGYNDSGFTRLVHGIAQEQEIQIVAFVRDKDYDLGPLKETWKNIDGKMTVVMFPPDESSKSTTSYADHGNRVLQITGSTHVFCFGGAGTVADEARLSPPIPFKYWRLPRNKPPEVIEWPPNVIFQN